MDNGKKGGNTRNPMARTLWILKGWRRYKTIEWESLDEVPPPVPNPGEYYAVLEGSDEWQGPFPVPIISEPDPPKALVFLAGLFALPADRETVIGDQFEKYGIWSKSVGPRLAKWYLIKDVGCSALPVIKSIVWNRVVRVLTYVGLAAIVRRYMS